MQTRRTIARWQIDHDADATRRCYGQIPAGTGCTCIQCRNFDVAAGSTFPTEFVLLLNSLGVDPTKPAQLAGRWRGPSGLYLNRGWFHFVGTILAGEDAIHWEGQVGSCRFEAMASGLKFGFTAELALIPEVFSGLPLTQLEFETQAPWVLADPEPELEPTAAADPAHRNG